MRRLSPVRSSIGAGVLGLVAWVAGPSFASAEAVDGDKGGVATGAPAPVPEPIRQVGTKLAWPSGGRGPQLLWTGFRVHRDGGEVLIQTSASVEMEPISAATPGAAVFVLKHCRAARKIDRLPLETRFFDSSVTRVSLRQRGPDLEIVISLRQPVAADTRREVGPSGSSFWILRFPPANLGRPATASATP